MKLILSEKKRVMSKKDKPIDINLNDYIWETEEFQFTPKVNRHKKFIHAKKRQLQKEKKADEKKLLNDSLTINDHQRYMSKIEQSILQDYYDTDDEEDYKGYRVK